MSENILSVHKHTEEILKPIWNNPVRNPMTMGTYPLGTGCDIEIPYRHYHEFKTLEPWLPSKPFSCLEFGCGIGRWPFALADRLTRYLGIDISVAQLEVAKAQARGLGLSHLEFIEADVVTYNYDALYDMIYDGGCAQCIDDEGFELLLERTVSHLADDGVYIIRATVPCDDKGRYLVNDSSHYSVYRPEREIVKIARKHSLKLKHLAQTYLYLKDAQSWRSKELCNFVKFGMRVDPDATFELMKKYAEKFYDKPESFCLVDGRKLVHKFFIFKRV